MTEWIDKLAGEIRRHAEAALLRRLDAGSGFADARVASQIYLRDPAAMARLAGGTLRPQGTHRKALAEVEALIAGSEVDARETPLATLVRRFRLSLATLQIAMSPAAERFALIEQKQPGVWRWATYSIQGRSLDEGWEPDDATAKTVAEEALQWTTA